MESAVLLMCVCMIAGPVASKELIGEDPSLQDYQNEEDCFPFTETWYEVYRNFKEDPYFGKTAPCVRVTETGPYKDRSTRATAKYSPDASLNVTLTLVSSEGYDAKNVIEVQSADDEKVKFNFTTAYRECEKCKVFRHSYIDGGKGCSLWKPKSQLGMNDTCCDFVFDLLCGTSNKYQNYSPGCEGSG